MNGSTMAEHVYNAYQKNIADTNGRLAVLRKSINGNSLLRLATILCGGAALFMAVQSEWLWLVMALFFTIIVLFMGLVWRQSKLEARKAALEDFLAVNQNEIDVSNGLPNRYPHGELFADSHHPYVSDLDVFGPSSLFAMVNRCATQLANRLLGGWLSSPAGAITIGMRQQTVKELAGDRDWCQQFQAKLWFNLQHRGDFKAQFDRFLNNEHVVFGNSLMRLYVKVAPWLMALLIGLALFEPVFSRIALFFALGHFLVAIGYGRKINLIAGEVGKAGRLLGAFAASFELIETRKWQSQLGQMSASALYAEGETKPVSIVFRELAVLIDRLDYRLNMLVGAVLNMVALWDLRQAFAILDWRKRYGVNMLNAFDSVAEIEALVSLATLSRNHPQWAFPEVVESKKPIVHAQALAHPLISPRVAVANDYSLENHRVALITGSNMAGKSTFLRTVGINAVLALCGAPVCAKVMRLSSFHLVTYMRIADSLNESTSTFKAELNRIQLVLQTVKYQPNTFFLVDEMLRGTNSMDKYLGSKAIIKQLIADDGVGMVATHDLQLSKLAGEYPGVLANYHFDIQVKDAEMLFDYKLKSGECTIFNASLLLKGIGININ
ncbi:MutS domain V [Parapedobacter koreensis]|uniref:MutS domain V n=2 Tax=Parapedobacter koreensis TaxID=332977 RepID=A0A1H7IX77_9SPHI|nr:MutS domain V [Parapedobacter koreensis]